MFGRKKKPEDNPEPNGPVNHNNGGNADAAKKQQGAVPPQVSSPVAAGPSQSQANAAHPQGLTQTSSNSNLNASSSTNRHPNQLAKSMDKMKIDEAKQNERPASAEPKPSGGASSNNSNDPDKKKTKPSISYAAERVIGSGSFGVVYQATIIETGETVAIKKVLQDRRFKNRELQVMRMLDHPCVVKLKNSFLAKGDKPDEVYLNLVMEFISETIHRTLRNHTKAKKLIPIMYTKVYMFQVCRALAYIHSQGICHRDIKPQNLLLDPNSHTVKLCDFGSAKILQKGQSNVAYICSRYYRAPELVFEATEYTNAIDIWSLGCVMGELLIGKPIFPGDSSVDQLIEIIKILGTPSREEIFAMNPNHTSFTFPQITAQPWTRFFRDKAPADAIDLISRFLIYKPTERLDPLKALAHEFFDDLRKPDARLPNGKPLPPSVFNFTQSELKQLALFQLTDQVIPPHIMKDLQVHQPSPIPPHDESKVDP